MRPDDQKSAHDGGVVVIDCPRRSTRRNPGGARVTARDLLALLLIGRAGVATAAHVGAFCSCSVAVARRRLRTLRDLGLVDVHVVAIEAASRFTLTPKGRDRVVSSMGVPAERLVAARGIGRGPYDHDDGIVDVFVALSVATSRSTKLQLVDFLFERECRALAHARPGSLVPDAVAILATREGAQVAYVIEVDEESENPSWLSRRKVRPIGEAMISGTPLFGRASWRALCVVPSRRRMHSLVRALWTDNVPEGAWHFAVHSDLAAATILREGWVTPRVFGEGARLVEESPFDLRALPGSSS